MLVRSRALVGALVLALLVAAFTSTRVEAATTYPVGNVYDGFYKELTASTSIPPGMNDWSCKPSAAHPYPVILVHGTLASEAFTWQALSPMLANAGYCVFGFNYGDNGLELLGIHLYGVGDIAGGAGELAAFVDQVLAATGASKVDMVGHSQGGMMPRYYLKYLGGAAKTRTMIGLVPSNHGTTLLGLNTLVNELKIGGVPLTDAIGCVACTQQIVPSSFMDDLNAGGDTVPGPRYVVITTKYDEIVTPYTSAYLSGPNVQNIRVQDRCWLDFTDHIGIAYDPVALQYVMNALGPNKSNFWPRCSLVLPVFSN